MEVGWKVETGVWVGRGGQVRELAGTGWCRAGGSGRTRNDRRVSMWQENKADLRICVL